MRSPSDAPIRVIDGPDAALLDPRWLAPGEVHRVGPRSDRMGLRLEGPTWPVSADPERVSTPVAPGALQVAGGHPLLLGVACGTMGGYPHVAHVISADLDRVAQLRPGDAVQFERVSFAEARRLDAADRRERGARLKLIATAAADSFGEPRPPV